MAKDGDKVVAQLISKSRMRGVDYPKWLKEISPLYWALYGAENRN